MKVVGHSCRVALLAFVCVAVAPVFAQQPVKPATAWGSYTPNLPTVFLTTTQTVTREAKAPCQFILVPAGSTNTNALAAVPGTVRIHGASSTGYPKKSLAVSLAKPVELPGLKAGNHWVLNAAYIDRSLMRHKLSYDLFQAMSKPGAKRPASGSRFIDTYVNGKYQGVFLMMQRVDRTLLGLTPFQSNAVSHACIYKASDHTGAFAQGGHGAFEQREPEPTIDYWKPLDELTHFVATAKDAELFDPEKGITTRLDLDSAIDFQLLVLLTSNMDGIDKNFMIARDAISPGKPAPKFFFIPWDYDATFGRNWEGSRVGTDAWLSMHLFDRLLANADYRKRFTARWKELRASVFAEKNIVAMIDDNVKALGDAVTRNAERWRGAGGYPDQLTFTQDIAQMKEWLPKRLAWLDAEIERRSR